MLNDKDLKLPVVFGQQLPGVLWTTTCDIHELTNHYLLSNWIHFFHHKISGNVPSTQPDIT